MIRVYGGDAFLDAVVDGHTNNLSGKGLMSQKYALTISSGVATTTDDLKPSMEDFNVDHFERACRPFCGSVGMLLGVTVDATVIRRRCLVGIR
ncbi:hypothetical protein PsorP6_007982 [Peronosclerospora sorghi]|uniref:Uncharacterized protein n=1 Tax=Peronosclerospora sorghi TaxID=230839 RepID=A0ACC0W8T2_9STRA|nr:hypothetical protein PsorP6_007982 [Peronosclerospora sorghi]